MSEADVEIVEEYADMMQVGARNMQNFSLLRKLAACIETGSFETWAIGDSEGVATGG